MYLWQLITFDEQIVFLFLIHTSLRWLFFYNFSCLQWIKTQLLQWVKRSNDWTNVDNATYEENSYASLGNVFNVFSLFLNLTSFAVEYECRERHKLQKNNSNRYPYANKRARERKKNDNIMAFKCHVKQ